MKFTIFNILIPIVFVLFGCKQKNKNEFTFNHQGFYYKLLSFEQLSKAKVSSNWCKISLQFTNQKDSVFWDSYNNYNDFFVLNFDSSYSHNIVSRAIKNFALGDSVSLLVKTKDFFDQQFHSNEIPFFSSADTVVKVNFKITGVVTPEGYENLKNSLALREQNKIQDYFGSSYSMNQSLDSLGFYWIQAPKDTIGLNVAVGNTIVVDFEGAFLNGRFLEKSPIDFEWIYGTKDQVLNGINYVITRLKVGQTAKIILPSHLAFGQQGSSNGLVPPFTPLVYKITLKEIKN